MRIKDVIAHLFDHHVMHERDWSLDRVTAWLRPLEPADQVLPERAQTVPELDPVEAAGWQRVRRDFEAHVSAKRHRVAHRPE